MLLSRFHAWTLFSHLVLVVLTPAVIKITLPHIDNLQKCPRASVPHTPPQPKMGTTLNQNYLLLALAGIATLQAGRCYAEDPWLSDSEP